MLSQNWVNYEDGGFVVYPNINVFRPNPQVTLLHTFIRDKTTPRAEFIFYCDRLGRLLIEEGLCFIKTKEKNVITPTNTCFYGCESAEKICGIPISMSGKALENGLRSVCRTVRIGKILIEKNSEDISQLYYFKCPDDISTRTCLLLDPIIGSGNTACMAIKELLKRGVKESNIKFLSLIATTQGLCKINKEYPKVTIVTTAIDKLNEKGVIIPGIGEKFDNRYFGTEN